MRLKSYPRHLPRNHCLKKLLKSNSGADSMGFFSKMKSEGSTADIKTVNFNNVYDIIKEVDIGLCEKKAVPTKIIKAEIKPASGFQNVILPNGIKLEFQSVDGFQNVIPPINVKAEIQTLDSVDAFQTVTPSKPNEALDLSKSGSYDSTLAIETKYKDSYLYQIMTNPELWKKAAPERLPVNFWCPYCKKEFFTESKLKSHLYVVANGSNQLICCVCGKMFAQKRYLRYHQRCHSERSKFECEHCSRKYSRLDNLTRHTVFHTNPGKFPCNVCERSFARKDLLNKHLKSHENKYKHYCVSCQKYFKGPVSLNNHVKSFHPDDPEAHLVNVKSEKLI